MRTSPVCIFLQRISCFPSALKSPEELRKFVMTDPVAIGGVGVAAPGTTASPTRPLSPVMKLGLIGAPVVALYTPISKGGRIVLLSVDTKRLLPDNTSPQGVPPR